MTKRTPAAEPTPAFAAAMLVYGLDDGGKPHAAAFAADEVDLAMRAAGLMRLVALPVASDECRALALSLPRGRIFASGRAFTPFVKRAAYEALKALGGEMPPAPEPPPADPFVAMLAAAVPALAWDSLAAGQLVLAPEEDSAGGGHWPALVTEMRPESLVILRWREWPDLAAFPRRIVDLGLLHSTAGGPLLAEGEVNDDASGSAPEAIEAVRSNRDDAAADLA